MNEIYVRRGDRLAARDVAGEVVILAADDSSMFVLNGIGSEIWHGADGRTPLSAIVDRIVSGYDVDRATAAHDAEEFVASLAAAGILITSASAIEEPPQP